MQRRALSLSGAALLGTAAALLGLVGEPRPAQAFCVNTTHYVPLRSEYPDLEIPVYLATGFNTSIENTGVSSANAARILLEVIARHNETVVAPKLRFAGFTDVAFVDQGMAMMTNSLDGFPRGITILGVPCGLFDNNMVMSEFFCNAQIDPKLACAYQHENMGGEIIGVIPVMPPMCEAAANSTISWSIDGSTAHDLAQTYLHEIGHILGLYHSNIDPMQCASKQGGINGNPNLDNQLNTGVMRTTNSSFLPLYRHWRIDDLDGLEFLWSQDYPQLGAVTWPDDNYPTTPELGVLASVGGPSLHRSPTLADAAPGGLQPVVSIDEDRYVVLAMLAPDDTISAPFARVDPNDTGRTAGSPAVALGSDGNDERVFVAWTANEGSTSETMTARWALRAIAGGPWTRTDGFELRTSRVTAGFDPDTNSWLVVSFSLAAEPSVSLVDYDGNLLLQEASLGVSAFDFSNPICGHGGSGCTMLVSGTTLPGLQLNRVDFSASTNPAEILVESINEFEQDVYGHLALSTAGTNTLRAVAGRYRFELGTEPDASLVPAVPALSALERWPIGLGVSDGAHRLGHLIEVECGDGLVHDGEACDDGNVIPGDGCDDTCMIEVGPSGTESESETGGGPPFVDGEGCTCTSTMDRRTAPVGGVLVLGLLVLGRARRRRRVPNKANPVPK